MSHVTNTVATLNSYARVVSSLNKVETILGECMDLVIKNQREYDATPLCNLEPAYNLLMNSFQLADYFTASVAPLVRNDQLYEALERVSSASGVLQLISSVYNVLHPDNLIRSLNDIRNDALMVAVILLSEKASYIPGARCGTAKVTDDMIARLKTKADQTLQNLEALRIPLNRVVKKIQGIAQPFARVIDSARVVEAAGLSPISSSAPGTPSSASSTP